MHKQTKHNKRMKRKNKTLKYYGGATEQSVSTESSVISNNGKNSNNDDNNNNKLANKVEDVFKTLEEKGLSILGLQFKNTPDGNTKTENTTPGTGTQSNFMKVVDEGTAAIIANIKDVLPKSVEMGQELVKNLNNTYSSPEIKEQTEKTMNNFVEYAKILNSALDKDATNKLNEIVTKVSSSVGDAVVKTGLNISQEIPVLGAAIAASRIVDDGSNAIADVTEAITEAKETVSEIKKNVDENLEKLNEQKKETEEIANRTTQSINEFKNPLNVVQNSINNKVQNSLNAAQNSVNNKVQNSLNAAQNSVNNKVQNSLNAAQNSVNNKVQKLTNISGGKGKTRRKDKRNIKSKRVRFAI
jgi:hypothetical protein